MVDFNKKIVNSKKFLQPAIHFQEHGLYCFAPVGTTEYMEYWEREQDRCLNGYIADDGDWISGYNYFYLNYCPILRIVEKEIVDRTGKRKTRRERVREFPDFYDYDYYFFMAVQEAQEQGKHLAVLKSRRKGYEQPYSEDVLTPTGFKKMGDLEAGDLVMNPGGQPTVILEIVEQGLRDVYEVEFQDGRTVRCGENHLWSTVNATRGKIHIMRTKDYAKRKLIQGSPGKEYYPYKIPALNPLKFDSSPLDIDPYVLGVLIGDGCLSSSQIFFSSDDEFIVEEMRKRLPDYEIKKSKTPFQYVILSKEKGIHRLGRKLKEYGLRVKSEQKFIPEVFKHSSVEDRFELVRGLMDTDGSCTKGASTFTNTSERLVDDLTYVLRSLGIRCKKSREIEGRLNVDFNNGHFSDTRPHWELCITTEDDIFKLPRKLEKIRNDRQYNFNGIGIKAVRKLGYKENQRCIVVDHENSLYVTKDFIATHNSFKLGAMMCRNYYHIPGSKSFAFAAENEFLVKDGIITKAWEYMDFIDENTAWGKKRQKVDTKMHRRASFVSTDDTGNKIELGYKSEIIGVTTKNDVNKIRGKAGHLIVIEEGGKFPNLLELWQIARPSVEQDGVAFGTMIVFGCVCAGTRVCTADGRFVNIEDLHKDDGIIGWDTYQAVQQKIENINPPSEKECVRITLRSGRILECSTDHPLLWSTPSKSRRVPGKRDENTRMKSWLFHEAGLCKVGEQVGIIDEVPIFGNKEMWEPRLVGWLIGDGSYGLEKTPRLSSYDIELNSYIDGKFDTVIERSYTTKDGKEYRETRIKGICGKLRDLGIYGQTKSAKRLPVDIYDYNYESSMELLGGLFDTDGYIMFTNNRCKIVLTQAYKEILLQVQELLLKIGVHSIIRYIKPSNRDRKIKDINGEYRLEINDNTSLAKFSRNVNMSIGYKNAALDLIALYTESHLSRHRNYVSGIHADKIVKIENIGVQPIYNITAADNHNYICNGIVTHNTGGSDGDDFSGLRELFYYPEGYNCLPLDNIWDEGADGTKCGFFIPQYTNLDIRDENGVRLYMDEDGNTYKEKSKEYVLGLREDTIKNSTDARAIDRYVAEQPITPQEACLELTGNIFPKKELQAQLSLIKVILHRTTKLDKNIIHFLILLSY